MLRCAAKLFRSEQYRLPFRMSKWVFLLVALICCCGVWAGEKITGPLPQLLITVSHDEVIPSALLESNAAGFLDQLVEIINQERLNNGALPPLKRNEQLDTAAGTHSNNMGQRDFFSHCDPDTQSLPEDRMDAAGYNWNFAAENIAAGQNTPEAVMAAWMNSSGHRQNILSSSSNEIGVGYFSDPLDTANVRLDQNGDCISDANGGPYLHYWTQNFGRQALVFPLVIERELIQTSSRNVDLYLYGAAWATEMRLRNENSPWTVWQAFVSAVNDWQLSAGGGLKEVFVELRNGAGDELQFSDTIWLQMAMATFSDVPQSHWAYEAIEAIAAAGITSGCGGGKYCPSDPVTRAQMAVFVLRSIHGADYLPPPATGIPFNDVPAYAFAASWIEQLALEGITTGCGNDNYCPEANISRAQMAVFLLRALYGSAYVPPPATGIVFDDIPVGSFAAAWIEQLSKEGISGGCGNNNYCPMSSVNRDQMAVFLARAFDLGLE